MDFGFVSSYLIRLIFGKTKDRKYGYWLGGRTSAADSRESARIRAESARFRADSGGTAAEGLPPSQ